MAKPLACVLVHDVPAWRVREVEGPSSPGTQVQEPRNEPVVVEATVELKVNGRTLLRFRCLPDRLDDLAVGFLASEGLIESPAQVRSLGVDGDCIRAEVDVALDSLMHFFETVTLVSGCGRGGAGEVSGEPVPLASGSRFSPAACLAMMREMERAPGLFEATGGVHRAALSDGETVLDVAEDIGRHNAVDKVIGRLLREADSAKGARGSVGGRAPSAGTERGTGRPGLAELMLLSSGRLSSDIVAKACRVGLPMVVSRSAPTSAAVEMAKRAELCLVGFARGHRLNVYSASWRLGLPTADGDAGREGKSE